ncbi:hypothetical protein K2Z84_07715 [Candidatus Binatia bacterium]|jgi:hypothetical protein|nr:hypothetical protein [Candidatus Binatia bacterium]
MSDTAELPPPARLRAGRIGLLQLAVTAALVAVVVASGRGAVSGVVGGAALMYASLLLQHLAVGLVLRGTARSGLAIALFLAKLTLLLGVAAIGLRTTLLAPMSFAAGASTLLLAIVIDACYGSGSASGAR